MDIAKEKGARVFHTTVQLFSIIRIGFYYLWPSRHSAGFRMDSVQAW